LIVPKYCGAKLTDIPDDYLVEILPVAKRVAQAIGCENYNVVQNNGALAYQVRISQFVVLILILNLNLIFFFS